jgi:hypothetical protein
MYTEEVMPGSNASVMRVRDREMIEVRGFEG